MSKLKLKKLRRQVLSGAITVDEGRAIIGRRKSQQKKAARKAIEAKLTLPPITLSSPVQKSAAPDIRQVQLRAREDIAMAQFRSADDPQDREVYWNELSKIGVR